MLGFCFHFWFIVRLRIQFSIWMADWLGYDLDLDCRRFFLLRFPFTDFSLWTASTSFSMVVAWTDFLRLGPPTRDWRPFSSPPNTSHLSCLLPRLSPLTTPSLSVRPSSNRLGRTRPPRSPICCSSSLRPLPHDPPCSPLLFVSSSSL
ncbi:hypothetical protein B0H12DRAFT_1142226, partial [Mycena haematopus]